MALGFSRPAGSGKLTEQQYFDAVPEGTPGRSEIANLLASSSRLSLSILTLFDNLTFQSAFSDINSGRTFKLAASETFNTGNIVGLNPEKPLTFQMNVGGSLDTSATPIYLVNSSKINFKLSGLEDFDAGEKLIDNGSNPTGPRAVYLQECDNITITDGSWTGASFTFFVKDEVGGVSSNLKFQRHTIEGHQRDPFLFIGTVDTVLVEDATIGPLAGALYSLNHPDFVQFSNTQATSHNITIRRVSGGFGHFSQMFVMFNENDVETAYDTVLLEDSIGVSNTALGVVMEGAINANVRNNLILFDGNATDVDDPSYDDPGVYNSDKLFPAFYVVSPQPQTVTIENNIFESWTREVTPGVVTEGNIHLYRDSPYGEYAMARWFPGYENWTHVNQVKQYSLPVGVGPTYMQEVGFTLPPVVADPRPNQLPELTWTVSSGVTRTGTTFAFDKATNFAGAVTNEKLPAGDYILYFEFHDWTSGGVRFELLDTNSPTTNGTIVAPPYERVEMEGHYAFAITVPEGGKHLSIRPKNPSGNKPNSDIIAQKFSVTMERISRNELPVGVVVTTGQSNAERMVTSPGAPEKFTAEMELLDSSRAWKVVDGSGDGSALLYESVSQPSDNWWIDPDRDDLYGPRLNEALAAIDDEVAQGNVIEVLYHNQVEAEASRISSNTGVRNRWMQYWPIVWDILIERTGNPNCKVLIVPPNRRDQFSGLTADYRNGITIVRRWCEQIVATNPDKYELAPEMYDGPGDGGAHRTPPGYVALWSRMARKIASFKGGTVVGGVDGPRITAAQFNDINATATITHDGGTDITPATNIQGFTATDALGDLPITLVTRASANSVNITFGRSPVGEVTLEYGKGTLYILGNQTAYLDMLRDNQPEPLPLRFVEIVMTDNTPEAPAEDDATSVWSNTVFDLNAANTIGQEVVNLVETPADGSAQTAYNFYLGSSSNTGESNEPTLVAASGGNPAYLQSDGNDTIQQTTITPFMRNLANDRSMTLSLLMKGPSVWGTSVVYLFSAGGVNSSTPGFAIRYVPGSSQLRISSSDGGSLENGIVTLDAPLPSSSFFMLTISYVGATGAYQVWLNGTLLKSGTITNRKVGIADAAANFNMINGLASTGGLVAATMSNDIKNTTQVAALRDFYATKYGLTLT